MGTFYALGIVKEFTATNSESISQVEWNELLNEWLDVEQYTINFKDNEVKGSLKKDIFANNIEDFYKKLVAISNNEYILNWFNDYRIDIEKYQTEVVRMKFKQHNHPFVLTAELALLFIEGKVLVEEFNTEPMLMNWLFRHADLSNKLAGCVMSDIVG